MTPERRPVRLVNVRHGKPADGRGRVVYGHLIHADTGELEISATLEYIMQAIAERNYVLVGDGK